MLKENINMKNEEELRSKIEKYFDRLWPIMRSITGKGARQTLDIISELIPLSITEIKTGTIAFDWIVPEEWIFRSAVIKDLKGNVLLDAEQNNLHVVNYSLGINAVISREELHKHLYTLEDQPDAIPYVTSYYERRWGFALPYTLKQSLKDEFYEVFIDAEHVDGTLTYGEFVLPGLTDEEIIFSTYVCHPSMANNELSGPLTAAFLANQLMQENKSTRKFTYRFIFIPETIGSIVYLSKNSERMMRTLKAGYVLTCLGDKKHFTLKKSRRSNTIADIVAMQAFHELGGNYEIREFFPDRGSDERQYCSPGFNMPFCSIMRSVYGEYPEYHTSLDNKSFIDFLSLMESISLCKSIVDIFEKNKIFKRINPFCEPNLGRRNIYSTLNHKKNNESSVLMWVLNYSDGENSVVDIAKKSGYKVDDIYRVSNACMQHGLLEEIIC